MNMTTGSEWEGRLGAKWAGEWQRTDRSFTMLTERLLQRSREFVFRHVLDIGCGAGELSLALGRGRPQTTVHGVDISPDLLDTARLRGKNLANTTFELADAAIWAPPATLVPDFLVSRHGVMFFADPQAAFTNLLQVSAPESRLMFSCFRDRSDNQWVQDMADLLPPGEVAAPDPHAPGPFAFGDPNRVKSILAGAGWKNIEFESFDYAQVAGGGEDPVADAVSYFLSIGPAALAARQLSDAQSAAFGVRLRAMLSDHLADGIVSLRAAAWIVTASKE